MYWSAYAYEGKDGILKAEMDGTNAAQIVTGLDLPAGIVIDFISYRLFWADYGTNKIQSSNLDGTDIQLVAQLSSSPYTGPWGIAVTDEQLFWGNYNAKSIQRSGKMGQDVQTLYNGTNSFNNLVVASSIPVQTRPNHCEGQKWSGGICVLNKYSFRCI